MDENKASISSFYRDRSVFITGASGFIGKAVVEKLLRSCPDITTIYVLLRPKKGHQVEQRLEEILNSKLFERVKKEQPNATCKVVAIDGDMEADNLGINPSDEKLLTENVSVVIHSAATVRFDEPLKKAVHLNAEGTRKLIELSRKMKNLKAFVHVSTAYCRLDLEIIDEVIYKFPFPPKEFIEAIEWMSEDFVEVFSPYLIQKSKNTYAFTKALTEAYLAKECTDLPIAVVRPAIVAASWREPFPGWVDNYNAGSGIIVSLGKGITRCVQCCVSAPSNFIPVDSISNFLIATGWYIATHRPKDIMVYNFTYSNQNRITLKKVIGHVITALQRHPSEEILRPPYLFLVTSKISYDILSTLNETIPSYVFDTLAVLTGKKPRFVRLFHKVQKNLEGPMYCISKNLTYSTHNTIMLQEMLSPEDSKNFNSDIKSLSWKRYTEDYVLGVRQYLLKEDPATLPLARKKLQRTALYEHLFHCAFIVLIFGLLLKIFMN